MNILAHVHGYPPDHNAGAEWMLHHMLVWLQARGHRVRVLSGMRKQELNFEGITVLPEFSKLHNIEHYKWCDIAVSHLDRVGKVMNWIRRADRPALWLMHNTHRYSAIQKLAHRGVMCFNSRYTQNVPWYDRDSVIVNPPCPVAYYKTPNRGGAKYVTLINHCEQKGANEFYAMAERLPDVQFMAVKGGYYHQEKRRLPNVSFMENTPDIKRAYTKTKVLVMPSVYESWGRTAIEAAASGIPTIANPTPGLKESLADAGIFHPLEDLDAWAEEITRLMEDKPYYKERSELARQRADELDGLFNAQMEDLVELMDRAIHYKTKEPVKA